MGCLDTTTAADIMKFSGHHLREHVFENSYLWVRGWYFILAVCTVEIKLKIKHKVCFIFVLVLSQLALGYIV